MELFLYVSFGVNLVWLVFPEIKADYNGVIARKTEGEPPEYLHLAPVITLIHWATAVYTIIILDSWEMLHTILVFSGMIYSAVYADKEVKFSFTSLNKHSTLKLEFRTIERIFRIAGVAGIGSLLIFGIPEWKEGYDLYLILGLVAYGLVIELMVFPENGKYAKGVIAEKELKRNKIKIDADYWHTLTGISYLRLNLYVNYGYVYLYLIVILGANGFAWQALAMFGLLIKHIFVKYANNAEAVERVENTDSILTVAVYIWVLAEIVNII